MHPPLGNTWGIAEGNPNGTVTGADIVTGTTTETTIEGTLTATDEIGHLVVARIGIETTMEETTGTGANVEAQCQPAAVDVDTLPSTEDAEATHEAHPEEAVQEGQDTTILGFRLPATESTLVGEEGKKSQGDRIIQDSSRVSSSSNPLLLSKTSKGLAFDSHKNHPVKFAVISYNALLSSCFSLRIKPSRVSRPYGCMRANVALLSM